MQRVVIHNKLWIICAQIALFSVFHAEKTARGGAMPVDKNGKTAQAMQTMYMLILVNIFRVGFHIL